MSVRHYLPVAICLAAAATPVQAAIAPQGPASGECIQAAAQAERRWALPQGLLLAIGLAESGTRDPATQRLEPARFAVNVTGTEVAFSAQPFAVAAVAALQRRGVASIDVGCFQINLGQHPEAFATLNDAFDAVANADYTGGFLRRLFERSGDWGAAVAAYHSATPRRGLPYRNRVLRFWDHICESPCHGPDGVSPVLPEQASRDPHVIRTNAAASRIPVFTPSTLPAELRARLGFYTKS